MKINLYNAMKNTFYSKQLHIIMLGLMVVILLEENAPLIKSSNYFFYEAIVIIVCVGSGITDTYRSVRIRILATFFGLIVGILFTVIKPMNFFAVTCAYFLIFYVAERFRWPNFIGIGGIVFLVVYFYHNASHNESVLWYSAWRFLHTVIGASVVLLLSYFYLKNDHSGNEEFCIVVKRLAEETIDLAEDVLKENSKHYKNNLEILYKEIEDLKKQKELLLKEQMVKGKIDTRLNYAGNVIDFVDEIRIILYFLLNNNYRISQLDNSTYELLSKEYDLNLKKPANDMILYVNNLAVHKILQAKVKIKNILALLLKNNS